MPKLTSFIYGMTAAIVGALVIQGALTLWGFRNDYLQVREEHKAMYGYLAQIVATSQNKPVTRADVLGLIAQDALKKPTEAKD
jgi:hypothetical protein